MRLHPAFAALLLLAPAASAQTPATPAAPSSPADLVVTNARIYTVDEGRPVADAMAVRGGRVVFVGSQRGAMIYRGAQTRLLDADGATIIPGITDAHAHLLGLGFVLQQVDLVGAQSYEEMIARVAAKARTVPPGTWVLGHGWDQNDWPDTRLPSHDALSRAVPNNPVSLSRIDGHAVLANAAAMRIAGVTAATTDPAGGRLERGEGGAPTGVFVDNAMSLIESRIPAPTHDQIRDATLAAIRESNRWGLTGIHDAGVSPNVVDVYEEIARAGQYSLRNYVMVADDDSSLAKYFRRGPQSALYDSHLWIRAIKIVADGAMGSRGAALLDPYTDEPTNRGLLLEPPARIQDVAIRALRNGFQLNVHAIGDRANRLVLDAFEEALKQVPTADHRFRIEHVQLLNYADVPRFAKLDVIPSMQTSHASSDMYWTPNRVGYARALGSYAWRSLLNTGVVIANGTDFPVEEVNPLRTFHSAVTRQDENNWPAGGWFPEQRMTRDEALKSMTIWAAYAAFQERDLGSLSPGKLADFVILDRDIMRVAPEDILGTHVLATYISGRPVYQKSK